MTLLPAEPWAANTELVMMQSLDDDFAHKQYVTALSLSLFTFHASRMTASQCASRIFPSRTASFCSYCPALLKLVSDMLLCACLTSPLLMLRLLCSALTSSLSSLFHFTSIFECVRSLAIPPPLWLVGKPELRPDAAQAMQRVSAIQESLNRGV